MEYRQVNIIYNFIGATLNDMPNNGPTQDRNSLISKTIKKELDRVLRPTWHVIVGDHYGSFVTHEKGCFACMTIKDLWITIFRSA